ncbi:MAG: MFS transporter [Candidatus Bathyarchaeota archaeon]|nr:MFS transporter [Candidatus Bathyarchaeota archaeon A05DMB-5]MDH7557272.1 MFS transporter [Candidatus Bathyarchaeota archaeon]
MNFAEKLRKEFSFFRGNYLILIISWILMDFAHELPGTYYPDYVIQLGGSATILGVIMLVSLLTLASVQFLGGYLADKYGRRWLVSSLTFGVALSFIFYAIAQSWELILVGAVIQNLCLLYQPALNALMADSLPPEKRGMGFSVLNLIMSVSTTPGPVIALFLVTAYGSIMGMRIAYTIVIFLYLAAAIVRLKLKESIKTAEKISIREALRAYPKAIKEGINVWKTVPHSTRFLFFSELIMRFSIAMTQTLFMVYAFYVLRIGGPREVDPTFQLARINWGYVMIALFICMIFLSLPVGRLIDKIGRKRPLLTANLLMIPAILLFIFGNYLTLFISMPLAGFSMLLGFSSYQTMYADLVPQSKRGKITGSANFFAYILMALGAGLGGFLYDDVSPMLPFLLTAIFAIPSTVLILFVQEPKPEERQA